MQQADSAIATVFHAHLDALGEELRGARREERLRETVDELMRMQALLVENAKAAAACLDAIRADGALIEPLRELACELFQRHRERIARIREGELARATYVAQRVAQRRRRSDAQERGTIRSSPSAAP